MKIIISLFVVFFAINFLQANIEELKAKIENPSVHYKYKIKLLQELSKNCNVMETLKYLQNFIALRRTRVINTSFMEDFVVGEAYVTYAKIKINSTSKCEDVKYLFDQLVKTKSVPHDHYCIEPDSVYHYGVKLLLAEKVNNSNYFYLIKNYHLLSYSKALSVLRTLSGKITDDRIIPFYTNILENSSRDDKRYAAIGLSKINTKKTSTILLDYISEHPKKDDFNSVIAILLVKKGYRESKIYSLMENLYSTGNRRIQNRIKRAAIIISNSRVIKYLKDALNDVGLRREAQKSLEKVREKEKK